MKTFEGMFSKIEFDPSDATHLKRFQQFLDTGKWDVCPFKLNEDYSSVPGMIFDMMKNELMRRVVV